MPVVVQGVPELKKALKKYAPDLRKQMDDEIRFALKEVVSDAKAKVPGQAPGNMYNFQDKGIEPKSRTGRERGFPKYNGNVIRRGLTYSIARKRANNKGFSSLYSLLNKSAVGAIVETAGSVHPGGRTQKAGRRVGESSKNIGQSNNPNAGAFFVGRMNAVGPLKKYDNKSRYKGRILYAAYAENNGKALDAVMKAIDKASRSFRDRATFRRAA